ncbi:hypothetical protein PR048_025145 [Dryococelus australis]|uniref:Uncharacterized protein n=1 Tax=Dryococelus australis TaxID=614101 RepID=A0ABQ9GQM0_9NEOP|nr:hypothetical protein PR048_025145 [Dryococelus australis]
MQARGKREIWEKTRRPAASGEEVENLFSSLFFVYRKFCHIAVNVERCDNEGEGETGDPRENPPTSGTIPTCENPVTRPGIEPSSPWWEASVLITQPPRPVKASDDPPNKKPSTEVLVHALPLRVLVARLFLALAATNSPGSETKTARGQSANDYAHAKRTISPLRFTFCDEVDFKHLLFSPATVIGQQLFVQLDRRRAAREVASGRGICDCAYQAVKCETVRRDYWIRCVNAGYMRRRRIRGQDSTWQVKRRQTGQPSSAGASSRSLPGHRTSTVAKTSTEEGKRPFSQ